MMDPVARLQADVWGRLSAHPFFAAVAVLNNERGIIGDDVEAALKLFAKKNGKSGAALVVDRPLRDVRNADAPGPDMEITIPVTVAEMPLINRAAGGTGRLTEELVTEVMSLLHGWQPGSHTGQCYCGPDAVTPTVGNDRVIVTEIRMRTRMRLATPGRVATPVISGDVGNVQIGCNTPDAHIYYTIDGSWPWAGNPEAKLFGITLMTEDGQIIVTEDGDPLHLSNPFVVAPGTLVRAAAYAEHKQGGNGAAAIFTT